MFNIGFGELAIICIVLIIAVGPERLPSMMKTVGKTMRTLRQASRDLRASTGIDELLREDFDYTPPPPRPRPAAEPAPVSRDEPLAAAAAALPSDEPVTGAPPEHTPPVPPLEHASVDGTLPSDAPVAAPEPNGEAAAPEPNVIAAAPEPNGEAAAPEPNVVAPSAEPKKSAES